MIQTSEYCAVGHPDRTCDYVASYILDRHLERDPYARVALEVQLKDCFCTLSGEITSWHRFTGSELAEFCREAIRRIGYTDEYLAQWGEGNVISGSGLEVVTHISRQSEDIAQGVNREGWGDQGIFWGLAVDDPSRGNMPKDYWLARMVAQELYLRRFGGIDVRSRSRTGYRSNVSWRSRSARNARRRRPARSATTCSRFSDRIAASL